MPNVIDGNSGHNNLTGTSGVDSIRGFEGNDRLEGLEGEDSLYGDEGNDTLIGGPGIDYMAGGEGDDTYYVDDEGDVIEEFGTNATDQGLDHVISTATRYVIHHYVGTGEIGTDAATANGATLIGNDVTNTLTGNIGNDVLDGADANDTLWGGGGNDTLIGGLGNDALHGDGGNNTASYEDISAQVIANLSGSSDTATHGGYTDTLFDIQNLIGGSGNDSLTGDGSSNILTGGKGNDTLDGGGGTDTASYGGTTGGVVVTLTAGSGTATGDAGTDTLISIENVIGGSGDDVLTGNNSSNALYGDEGDDTLRGGNDTSTGGDTDTLDGGEGTDTASYEFSKAVDASLRWGTAISDSTTDTLISIENLIGSGFADTLIGNDGDNKIEGGGGNDTLHGSNDTSLGGGTDTLDGGDGIDTASYVYSNDKVDANLGSGTANNGGDDDDSLIDIENLIGSAYDDCITGDEVSNVLSGGLGNDALWGDDAADTLNGDNGNDFLDGGDGNDKLYGNNGNDTLVGGAGDDTLDGGLDVNTASYEDRSEKVIASLLAGEASIGVGGEEDALLNIDNLIGGSGNNSLTGDGDNNTLEGRAGNDTLLGGTGNDVLDGGEGIDTASFAGAGAAISITLDNGAAEIGGAAGDDILSGIENLIGSSHNDTLNGDDNNNTLDGGAGNDSLNGGEGSNKLIGGTGDDSLYGGADDDTLIGGDGSDSLDGGDGSNTASYEDSSAPVVANLMTESATRGGDADTLVSIKHLIGGSGNDQFTGNASNNKLEGGLGHDVFYASEGNDTLNGGGGNDTVDYGTAVVGITVNLGEGIVSIGADTQTLIGIEKVIGSDGDDEFIGSANDDSLFGGDGEDILHGGLGNDILEGGIDSSDSFVFDTTLGSGNVDTINDFQSLASQIFSSPVDKIVLNNSIFAAFTSTGALDENDGRFLKTTPGTGAQDADDFLIYEYDSGTGIGRLYYDPDGNTNGIGGAAKKHFATLLDHVDLAALDIEIAGDDGGDSLPGTSGVDHYTGGEGDDTLYGQGGNDILVGNGGDDLLDGGADDDDLQGGDGEDTLRGDTGEDQLDGGDDDDELEGGDDDDELHGGAGDDDLDGGDGTDIANYWDAPAFVIVDLSAGTASGGAGDDVLTSIEYVIGSDHDDQLIGSDDADSLYGGSGDDSLSGQDGDDSLEGGSGEDSLYGGAGNDTLYGGEADEADTLEGGDGDDTYYVNDDGDEVIESDGGGTDTVYTLIDYTLDDYVENGYIDSSGAIDLTGNDLDNVLWAGDGNNSIDGGDGKDTVSYMYLSSEGATGINVSLAVASGQKNTVNSISGNDTLTGIENLQGSQRNDTLIGNGDDNVLDGYQGDDSLVGGGGNDHLYEHSGDDYIDGGDGIDTLSYSPAGSVGVKVDLSLTGPQDTALVGNPSSGAGLDTILHIENLIGTSGNDSLIGSEFANVLQGMQGYDTLIGGDGDDSLYGGTGNDSLTGGSGTDRFYFNTTPTVGGGGYDYISDFVPGTDKLVLDNNYFTALVGVGAFDENRFRAAEDLDEYGFEDLDDNDLILFDKSTGKLYYDPDGGGNAGAAPIHFATLNVGENGLDPDDVSASDIELLGKSTATGTSGEDTFYGSAGNDSISGLDGDDVLFGYDGNDSLYGGDDDDALSGGDGDDLLDGGSGADEMIGGDGNDTYYIDDEDDAIDEEDDGGLDFVYTSVDYDLADNVENARISFAGGLYLSGNDLDNILYAGAGGDHIDGGDGHDVVSYYYATAAVKVDLSLGVADEAFDSIPGTNDSLDHIEGIDGSTHNDSLVGDDSANTLYGDAGNDTLKGNGGNDTIYGDSGNDSIEGGAGTDTLNFNYQTVAITVTLTSTPSSQNTGLGSDTIGGIENLYGGSGADKFTGDGANNNLYGGHGNNTLEGSAGVDTLTGGTGADDFVFFNNAQGTSNADMITDFVSGTDRIVLHNDVFVALTSTGELSASHFRVGAAAQDSDDYLIFNAGSLYYDQDGSGTSYVQVKIAQLNVTTLSASDIHVTGPINIIQGGSGNDTIPGEEGDDIIRGGAGNDLIDGDDGNDSIEGGDGDDVMIGGSGNDTINGGPGIDTVTYEDLHVNTTAELGKGKAADDGDGGSDVFISIENLTGGWQNDIFMGSDVDNVLKGEGGSDILFGFAGDDSLYGGDGGDWLGGGDDEDYLFGGDGVDTLVGGEGQDYFWFESTPGAANADRIMDFDLVDDVIVLNQDEFTILSPGLLSSYPNNFRSDGGTPDSDDYLTYNASTGELFYDPSPLETVITAPLLIVTLVGKPAITAADIYIEISHND